ncbi:hypothetical protein [Candidatus Accumulibacter phosphatis]|uniref:hypothetical protein n=1 Tax=Candidatus Accumulibacter phosphatis TaxID=327160 RepID=UPI00110C0799|nr:hypothetical protein [Candidatus Accumulibacter phosphatis]
MALGPRSAHGLCCASRAKRHPGSGPSAQTLGVTNASRGPLLRDFTTRARRDPRVNYFTPTILMLIRPRLTDHFGIHKSQAELDFVIQFLDEDLPLYLDPFLLWKSPSQQDQALHTSITNSFNHLNYLSKKNKTDVAIETLVELSECSEVGLGLSKSRRGVRIGRDQAAEVLRLFETIPEYSQFGFTHFEVIQLYRARSRLNLLEGLEVQGQ